MRRFLLTKSGPVIFLSFISVLALGSYVLWKFAQRDACGITQKEESDAEEAGDEAQKPASPTHNAQTGHGEDLPEAPPANDGDIGILQETRPLNGTVFLMPLVDCVAPLTVIVEGSGNYCIYLKFIKSPENSSPVILRGPGDVSSADIAFFAKANSSVSLDVPVGIYSLNYAVGSDWYGPLEKFGPDTKYYKADEPLTFYTENKYLYGNTVRLFEQPDGKSPYHQIDSSDYPG